MATLHKAALAAAAVCYSTLVTALPQQSPPSGAPVARLPAPDAAVEVRDPRHRGIRIEVSASEAASSTDPQRLYRGLVRSSRVSANMAVVENGRVFFRNSASAVARSEPPAHEEPLVFKLEEQPVTIVAASPSVPPLESRRTPDAAPQATRRSKAQRAADIAFDIPEEVTVALGFMGGEQQGPQAQALEACIPQSAFDFSKFPQPPAPEQLEEGEDAIWRAHAPDVPSDDEPVIVVEAHGIVSLASLAEAGEWLVLRHPG